MTKKELFIEFIDNCISNATFEGWSADYTDPKWTDAINFWQEFKEGKVKNSNVMTENGKKILSWTQENVDTMNNIFTSKEIAEALFTSGRSVAGSMRKLVNDGYFEKVGKDPVQYSLTEKGKTYQFDN